ncbi:hypothetical protein GYMLUDRAFT_589933 [Collybiopsis luxurians FD-317 M1]|uniref:Uncharacterized protein n=1 Tax=Collybiopsis luxurians FD-317 M1 TaxID=944289 RepID=A0A0D0BZ53_9AGAR|nr:hypothetical protein GYMLUDRAFT_589933 [Collybiopsis luxurians FD-317 M1]
MLAEKSKARYQFSLQTVLESELCFLVCDIMISVSPSIFLLCALFYSTAILSVCVISLLPLVTRPTQPSTKPTPLVVLLYAYPSNQLYLLYTILYYLTFLPLISGNWRVFFDHWNGISF